jgi:dipeptidyl aminopeptidase/acylaminoacyl peptidase
MSTRLFAVIFVIVASAASSGAAGAAGLPDSSAVPDIGVFMQIGAAGSPQISEDGSAVFFRSSLPGVSQVFRVMPSGWPYQMTVFEHGIDFYRASYSGKLMVAGASRGGSEQSDLYLLDSASGIQRTLKAAKGVRHGSPLWSPDERYLYFSSNEANGRDFFIYRIDVNTGEVDLIWEKPGWNSAADISPDGARIVTETWLSNTNDDLYLVDVETGEETLLTEHDGDYVFDYPHLTPDAKAIYLITNRNDDGLRRVARLDVASGALEFVRPESPWETEEAALSRDGRFLAWVENVEGYGVLRGLDLETGKEIEPGLTTGIVSDVSISSQGVMVFTYTSPSKPPDVWRYDIAGGTEEQLTHSTYAGVDPALFVDPQLVKIDSFDGLEIPAFLYLPPNWDGRPIPFVIHAHGGPESQFRPSFTRHFDYLVLNGYGVLAPNVRGSSGYGRRYISLDDYKKRNDSVRDYYEAARWLVANGYSQAGRIAIKGGSYGGYVTLAALVQYPDVFGAGIDDVGIANFVTFLENTAEYRRAIREAEYGPLSDREFLTEISPITNVDNVRAPLLIVHGENDPRVPVGEARQMAGAIASRGGEVDTLIFADEGHGIAKLDNRLEYYRRMVGFLNDHLKRRSGRPAFGAGGRRK